MAPVGIVGCLALATSATITSGATVGASGAVTAVRSAATTTTTIAPAPPGDPRTDLALPVFAPGTRLGVARRWLNTAITVRVARDAVLAQSLSAATSLSAAQRAALGALLASTQAALFAAQAQIASLASLTAANSVADSVVLARVYTVVGPEVQLVIAATSAQLGASRLRGLEGAFETAISSLHHGADATRAARSYAHFASEVNHATVLAGTASSDAFAITPSSATGTPVDFAAARQALQGAQTMLQAGRTDLRRLVTLLAKPALRRLALPAG